MKAAPPLRFLALVLGGWVCLRAAILTPPLFEAEIPSSRRLVATAEASTMPTQAPARELNSDFQPPFRSSGLKRPLRQGESDLVLRLAPVADVSRMRAGAVVEARQPQPFRVATAEEPEEVGIPLVRVAEPRAIGDRWSFSAWGFLREGDSPQLAAGGILGGSQVGARILYRIRDNVALSGRAYAPLRSGGAEAALGIEWQPSRKLPVRLLAERRQAIGDEGRSAFALLAYGGVSGKQVAGPVLIDAYAQAGVVGLRSRDLFVDGEVRLGVPIGRRLSFGAGMWAAAQPGVERLDLGPQLTARLPVQKASVRVSADWRVRVAGSARPDSGPALTLATDF